MCFIDQLIAKYIIRNHSEHILWMLILEISRHTSLERLGLWVRHRKSGGQD